MTERGTQLVKGVLILGFRDESESETTGLKTGDVIVQYDGVGDLTVEKVAKLAAEKRTRKSQIPVVLVRDGHTHSLTLSSQSFGLQLQEATTRISSESNGGKDNDEDGPLFVFKYRGYQVFLRAVGFIGVGTAIGVAAYSGPKAVQTGLAFVLFTFGQIVACFLVPSLIFLTVDMLRTREIRIYRDRIVKIWEFRRPVKVQVPFSDAKYVAFRMSWGSHKLFFSEETHRLLRIFKGVYYDESLVAARQVSRLNRLLADLSGRPIEDFERFQSYTGRFIKEHQP